MAGSHSLSSSSSSSTCNSNNNSSRQQALPANLNDAKCVVINASPSSSSPDEMRTLDCNLSALSHHIQLQGWSTGAFSDVVVHAMGTTYCLHRLILSRSSYFRHMLEGPWKEAGAPELLLQIDDQNVNDEAVGLALAYLYGYHPKLDDKNAFRVLAAASFLDLQELCVICTDFIISELHTDNFLGYQTFAESQDYGIHGERVRKACWGFLCRGAAMELKEILPKLSMQTLLTLLISDELWVPNEERRLELAISVLMSKHVANDDDHLRVSNTMEALQIEEKLPSPMSNKWEKEQNFLIIEEGPWTSIMQGSVEQQSCAAIHQVGMNNHSENCSSLQPQALSMEMEISFSDICRNQNYFAPAWGGRVVERSQIKNYTDQSGCLKSEDWDDFLSLFEGGGILYCHMTFESLLNGRRRLEELDFPCKAVCDGLWLQTLLRQSVLSIGADTCMACSLFIAACNCRQTYIYPHARVPAHYYRDDQERNLGALASGSFQGNDVKAAVSGPSQGRVHVRGTADGLAALVGLSQGSSTGVPLHSDQATKFEEQQHIFKVNGDSGPSINTSNGCSQKADSKEHTLGQDWEANKSLSISLDLETPLRAFPPFRFGVEFDNVHRLADGQSKHSLEIFYAGSLWKVSAQAFRNEDPHGRRTLGLFLHRRRAENVDSSRKVYLYTDTREKVTARYQLICPSKREVMIFGSLTQAGTLLPKAPKGWGWRTAFLFDELTDLLPGGSLRVAAVIQVV